jgi:hypothetical protein
VNVYPEAIVAGDLDDATDALRGGNAGLRSCGTTAPGIRSSLRGESARRVADFNEMEERVVSSSGSPTRFTARPFRPATVCDDQRGSFARHGRPDGDGHVDLVTASQTDDSIGVLNGKGDGTFLAKVDYAVETRQLDADRRRNGDLNGALARHRRGRWY